MASPGTFVDGVALAASELNDLPAGIVARAVYSVDQGSITGTETDLTGLSTTFTALANRYYVVVGLVPVISTVSADEAIMRGYLAGSIITGIDATLSNVRTRFMRVMSRPVTVSAGSVTAKLTLQRVAGTGTLTAQSGAALTSHIAVYDMGPV